MLNTYARQHTPHHQPHQNPRSKQRPAGSIVPAKRNEGKERSTLGFSKMKRSSREFSSRWRIGEGRLNEKPAEIGSSLKTGLTIKHEELKTKSKPRRESSGKRGRRDERNGQEARREQENFNENERCCQIRGTLFSINRPSQWARKVRGSRHGFADNGSFRQTRNDS